MISEINILLFTETAD